MGNLDLALKTLERMDLGELRRVYRSTFRIKTIEPYRDIVAGLIVKRGAKLPKISETGLKF